MDFVKNIPRFCDVFELGLKIKDTYTAANPKNPKIYMDFVIIIPRFCDVNGATPKRLGASPLARRGAKIRKLLMALGFDLGGNSRTLSDTLGCPWIILHNFVARPRMLSDAIERSRTPPRGITTTPRKAIKTKNKSNK